MALGKYSRVDGRKPSSCYCSTVTIVVFVALCLVGVWMMTSSSVVPVQNSDVSQENKNEVKTDLSESNTQSNEKSGNNESNNSASEDNGPNDDGKSKQFEDNPGDLPEDATKGDNDVNSNSEEKTTEEKQEEEKPEDQKKEDDTKSENAEEKKEDGQSCRIKNLNPEKQMTILLMKTRKSRRKIPVKQMEIREKAKQRRR